MKYILFRCEQFIEVSWLKKELRDEVEKAAMFSMKCGPLEAGKWRFSVEKAHVENPFIYQLDMLFLDLEQHNTKQMPDMKEVNLLQGMWSMDTVSTLPLEEDLYPDQQRLQPFLVHQDQSHHQRHKRSTRNHHHHHQQSGFIYNWIICSGGLVTVILSLIFSYHTLYLPLRHPSRHQKRALYYSVTAVLVTCVLQSLMCSFLCTSDN